MPSRSTLPLLALLASSSIPFADTITGRVIDANGNPVPGVNIDAFRVSNGNEEVLANDGTNANGDFVTTIPPNVYDIHFIPPAPPTTTHLTLVVHNVVVTGTKNLGTLQLPAGVSLSGHLQTQGGVPVGGVDLSVLDQLNGSPIPQAQKSSDAFGNFNLAVPTHAVELRLDASDVTVFTLASKAIDVSPVANTNLGNIVLQNGFPVSGTVVRTVGGSVVPGVDIDVIDTATGDKLYTPGDNSNALGIFSVVLPVGNYDIEFCPTFASSLVGKSLNRTVSAGLGLGPVSLDAGFALTGTIRSFDGAIQVNSDVDVRDMVTGQKVITCFDNSNASGAYTVVVPSSTLKVIFHPPNFGLELGSNIHKNLIVTSNMTLDGTLPLCSAPNNYGTGLAGTGGIVPHLTTSGGTPVVDNGAFAVELQNGRGGATAFLMISVAQDSRPLLGGTLLVANSSSFFTSFQLGGTPGVAGAGSKSVPANLGPVAGINLYMQYFAQDPNAAQGWAFSEGLHLRACR